MAEEIRKLSVTSTSSVKEIAGALNMIQRQMEAIDQAIAETDEISSHQATASCEISAAIESLPPLAESIRLTATKV